MTYSSQTSGYLANDIMSRRPEWLVPLLYEHLLVSLQRAGVQITARDFEGKAKSLDRASAIIAELLGSLDHEKGGEIAAQLSSLYAFFTVEILNIGRTLDQDALGRLVELISELHGAWVAAAEQVAPRASVAAAPRPVMQLA
ncbi:MAG: flagellar export chaperone FliS [Gemmatimonadetes bacterium]|nr:flagellar export chaperone FliS [Gemmatimonadota bacterium]